MRDGENVNYAILRTDVNGSNKRVAIVKGRGRAELRAESLDRKLNGEERDAGVMHEVQRTTLPVTLKTKRKAAPPKARVRKRSKGR